MLCRKLIEAEIETSTVYAVIRKHLLVGPAGYDIIKSNAKEEL
jgi:hypothetical protein